MCCGQLSLHSAVRLRRYRLPSAIRILRSEPFPDVLYARNALAARTPAEGAASDPAADLQFPLAAAAAVYRLDRRAGRLCGAVSEGVVAPVRPRLRFQRAADHAGGAGADRCGDDFPPAG